MMEEEEKMGKEGMLVIGRNSDRRRRWKLRRRRWRNRWTSRNG